MPLDQQTTPPHFEASFVGAESSSKMVEEWMSEDETDCDSLIDLVARLRRIPRSGPTGSPGSRRERSGLQTS